MYIPIPYFKNVPDIGDLKIKEVFVENGYPILFTCSSDNNDLFLCLCREIYGEQKWVISQVNDSLLHEMETGKISVYNVFKNNKNQKSFYVFWKNEDGKNTRYKILKSSCEIEDKDLPEKDFFLN